MVVRPSNIIIVGGGGTVGAAVAEKLSKEKNVKHIILAGRNVEKLEEEKERIKGGYANIATIKFDITSISSHIDFLNSCQQQCGNLPIDCLLIISGKHYPSGGWRGFNISESDWDSVMDTNLKGPYFLLRNFTNWDKRSNMCNVLIVSSVSAYRDCIGPYQISKNAISNVCKGYGKHLYKKGIILNCIEPGPMYSKMLPHLRMYDDGIVKGDEWKDNALSRLTRPEEVADVILFLISDVGELMCGSCINCAGGTKSIIR